MKILVLSSALPHAKCSGGHVIVRERIQRLAARGHQVGLVCFTTPEDAARLDEVRPWVNELETAPLPHPASLPSRAVRLCVSSIPPYYCDYRDAKLMRRVGDLVERNGYDVVIAEFSAMGQYLHGNPYLPAVRKIISCHYSVATSYRKVADLLRYSVRGLRSRISLKGLQRFEVDMYRHADRILVLTAQERYGLLNYDPALRISVIPAGVDTTLFTPDPVVSGNDIVLFTGNYSNLANVDAALWFAHTAWPIVRRRHPQARFHIVGPDAPRVLLDLPRRDPSIAVLGEVDNVRDTLAQARVFVCPVRLGSGLRVKLLEALSMGLPLVTTGLGGEGIPLQTGENCLIADQPQLMADSIDLLLSDEVLRTSLSRKARQMAVERFSWNRSIDLMEKALGDLRGTVR